jgi:quinoprotein glucose dehydrogenase
MDIPNTGTGALASMTATKTLLMYGSQLSDGTPALFAVDKATGETIGVVEVDSGTIRYGTMTYMHEGTQYVVLQAGAALTTLALGEW